MTLNITDIINDCSNRLIHHRVLFFRFGSTQKTAVQLLGLVLSAIVADTNVDIAEVLEMNMSDLRSPQTLDIEYDRWMRKWQSETNKKDALQTALQVRSNSICLY